MKVAIGTAIEIANEVELLLGIGGIDSFPVRICGGVY